MKVLIIGLKDLHIEALRNKFKTIKFKAINHQGKYINLPNGRHFNCIFNLTKFSNHDVHNKYKDHGCYNCIEGGRSSLIKVLESIIPN